MALEATLAAIDNMASEGQCLRLTAIQQSVISRKKEYDDLVRLFARRAYLEGKPGRGNRLTDLTTCSDSTLRRRRREESAIPESEH